MIAVPVVASTPQEALRVRERAEEIADCVEIRLDLVPREVWTALLRKRNKPLIVTLRPARQGGSFQGEEGDRIRLLKEALKHEPDFIDLEWDTPPHLIGSILNARRGQTRLIVSYHDMFETPSDLGAVLRKTATVPGAIRKIVPWAKDLVDSVRILRLVEEQAEEIIAFCMGPFGVASRILTLRAGGYLTFGALEEGRESAPGQVSARDLKELYGVERLKSITRVFGVVGNPVGHSLSPAIHNAAFRSVGYDGVYVPLQVENLENVIDDLASIGVEGFSVTIPHKEGIMSLLNDIDGPSRRMGAVNTVHREDDRWLGSNTDVYGAWKALEALHADLQGKRWTIIGAGGVARAVACAAASFASPRTITVLGRTAERLRRFLVDLTRMAPCTVSGLALAEADLGSVLEETDIVVNGTPVGMTPEIDRSPISARFLKSRHLVFDTVYNPVETQFLRQAKGKGCRTVSGMEMFLHQGAAQFERWTGMRAPLELMKERARARLIQ